MDERLQRLQDIIGTDAGNRGMKPLIVKGDLADACRILANPHDKHVVILSGFPCCVQHTPPTETDGPPGAVAILRAVKAVGWKATLVTDECNAAVFRAAAGEDVVTAFSADPDSEEMARLEELARSCDVLVACERAGPSADGQCYTMRKISMAGLIAPLHRFVDLRRSGVPFIGIGDGGNELGMGKVLDRLHAHPTISSDIACVTAADHLIAASVSNWGGYALAAGIAIAHAYKKGENLEKWVRLCVPSREEEIALLDRCVARGCRDGVSGKVEATVDGMPLETSLQCLDDLTNAALGK